jgi:hypothetical protein
MMLLCVGGLGLCIGIVFLMIYLVHGNARFGGFGLVYILASVSVLVIREGLGRLEDVRDRRVERDRQSRRERA